MSISKEEQATINRLELTMTKFEKDVEFIKLSLAENTTQHKDIMEKFELFIESADKRYASSWVEVAAKTLIGATVLAVLGALLSVVITK